jgi:hypothetical protein
VDHSHGHAQRIPDIIPFNQRVCHALTPDWLGTPRGVPCGRNHQKACQCCITPARRSCLPLSPSGTCTGIYVSRYISHPFNSHYPLPQNQPWTNVQPNSAVWSNVISTLRGQQLGLRQWAIRTSWTAYARESQFNPKPLKQTYLLAFAARVRTDIFGHAVQVGFQSVEKALRHMAQALVLAGFDDPRWTYGAKELDLL